MGSSPSKKRVHQSTQHTASVRVPSAIAVDPRSIRTRTPPSPVRLPRPRVLSPPPTVTIRRKILSPPAHHSHSHHHPHQSFWKTSPSVVPHRSPRNDQLSPYTKIWGDDGKLSSAFEGTKVLRLDGKLMEHRQEENCRSELTSEESSQLSNVEMHSILKSEIEVKHELITSPQLDQFIGELNKTNSTLDESVQQRIQQISNETEKILSRILSETEGNQQRLLQRAKEEQNHEDQIYRHELEEFLRQLDLQRAKKLEKIQSDLIEERQTILEESEMKVRSVINQANSWKTRIVHEEEKQATSKIETILEQINNLNEHSTLQQLTTQSKTQFTLIRQENIGSGTTTTNNKTK